MKIIEILELERNALELLHKSCIKLKDVEFLPLYTEYLRRTRLGEKKSYVVAVLSEKYHVSERKIYYIIKQFDKDCTVGA